MPIGCLTEIILAAHRACLKKVILPRRNESELEKIPDEVRHEMEFVLVDHIDQVLEIALKRKA
jgi:ATP-dependent Lon protease